MCCILCLIESTDSIVLLSPEGISLQIEQLIKKYIVIEHVGDVDKQSYICNQCWQAIVTFHEFCKRIESTHNLLKDPKANLNDPLEAHKVEPIDYIYIKEEYHEDLESVISEERNPLICDPHCKKTNTSKETENNSKVAYKNVPKKLVSTKLRSTEVEKSVPNKIINSKETTTAVTNVEEISIQNKQKQKLNEQNAIIPNISNVCKSTPSSESEMDTNIDGNSEDKTNKKVDKIDNFINANFTLICKLCTVQCQTFAFLKAHFRKTHNCKAYVVCCEKKFPKRCLLVDHINVHINADYFKCDECKKSFASRYSLEIHTRLHKNRQRIYQCNNCTKSFFSQPVYMRHMQLHATDEQKKFSCLECGEKFFSKYSMEQHLKCVHTDLHVKVCEHCGKSMRGLGTLRQHMELHNSKNTPIQCKECGIKVTTKYGLTRHIRKIHSIENNQKTTCDICFKVSPSISAHKYHMDYMHKAKRKHVCSICEKAFKRAVTLKEHMTTHNGGTLYTCSHCPKTFNSRANMYSHRKKVHREEWEQMHFGRLHVASNQV